MTIDPAATARRWMELIWSERDLGSFEQLHAPDFVDHNPAGRPADREGYRAGILDLFAAFPDFQATTADLIADPATGRAAIRWTANGTHLGPFLGRQATGRRVDFAGIEIVVIKAGRIVERWGEWDGLALAAQLDRPR